MPTNDDLLNFWLNQRKEGVEENEEMVTRHRDSASELPETPETPENRRPTPSLNGRLADFLAKQAMRRCDRETLRSADTPWTIAEVETRAAVATALILTTHIAQFAGTSMDFVRLKAARDTLIHTFKARDAVHIEVEAYNLLQWFATALDPRWAPEKQDDEDRISGETSKAAIVHIIDEAIDKKRDLQMRYYTGSRGEFSDRRITPLEISAEKYLIAYCHLRREERVFRLSRIARLETIVEDGSNDKILCYPNPEDLKLPPLEQKNHEGAKMPPDAVTQKNGDAQGNSKEQKSKDKGSKKPKAPPVSGQRSLFDDEDKAHSKKQKSKKTPKRSSGGQRSLF